MLVVYAAACKALLFRAFEYAGSDLYSFLEMSRSWLDGRPLLYENAYGYHAAIHSFYLLLAFAPLTLPWGAYGLFAGLVLLELLAVARVAYSHRLDGAGKLVVLGGLLSPLAYLVFDDPGWGFHPELSYLPLAVLLALDLAEDRPRRAVLVALAMLLVKEDGAVLVGAVLVAHFAGRLWALAPGAREERRLVLRTAAASLALVAIAFALDLALLWALGRGLPVHMTASGRTMRGLAVVWTAISGQGAAGRRALLLSGLAGYALFALALLIPLGARFIRGLALLAVSAPAVVLALAVSAGPYKFELMAWAPRLALLAALVLACLVFAARSNGSPRTAAALVLLSWGLQLPLLARLGYWLPRRANVWSLAQAGDLRLADLPARELAFLRCVADRVPRGSTIAPPAEFYTLFHRHSIVFAGLERHAWQPPRLRVFRGGASTAAAAEGLCAARAVGELALAGECSLVSSVASCGALADAKRP